MVDLNDKKNLPIIIGAFVVVLLVAGFFIYRQMKGPSPSPDIAANPAGSATAQPGSDSGSGIPGSTPSSGTPSTGPSGGPSPMPGTHAPGTPGGSTGMTAPSAPPAPSGMAPTTPGPSAPAMGAPGAPGAPGMPGMTGPGQTAPAAIAVKPNPIELWRADPFAPPVSKKNKKATSVRPIYDLPRYVLYTPPPIDIEKEHPNITPLPPRRVAGILLGDRISALLQTPDGWEMVKPGGTLRDGSVVQRIERDRVIIRTAEKKPRIVEIRLATADVVTPSTQPTVGGPSGIRGISRPPM
jgi:hypothetical protein